MELRPGARKGDCVDITVCEGLAYKVALHHIREEQPFL
jgi:hypothetical protein